MKRRLTAVSAFVLTLALAAGPVFAGGQCCKGGYGGYGHGTHGGDAKFFHKAHYLLENENEIGLTADQVDKIRALKLDTKKSFIRQEAEIEVAGLDLKTAEKTSKDLEAINGLIDKKYELKKAKAKMLAASYFNLKSIVGDDKWQAMKDLKEGKKESRKDKDKD